MMPIEEVIKNTKRISLKDYVCFTCTGCGECCLQVKESVALEPLDVFKITQFLRTRDPSIRCIEDVLDRYTVPIFLTETGYMMFAMATEGEDHHCIFLRNSRCIIHEGKPRVCKLYPFVAGPADHGGLEYLLSTEKPFHFKGQRIRAKAWMKKYLTDEEREFIEADAASVVPIARLLQDIPQKEQTIALLHFIRFKYSDFDLDQPFVPQYKRNMAKLEAVLQQMITNGETHFAFASQRLTVCYGGAEYVLTGKEAKFWLDGRYGVANVPDNAAETMIGHLHRMGLVECEDEDNAVTKYRLPRRHHSGFLHHEMCFGSNAKDRI